jgi:hypothetical protein
MAVSTVHGWLVLRRREGIFVAIVSCIFAAVAGAIFSAVAFGFAYLAVSSVGAVAELYGQVTAPHPLSAALTSVVMGLLFFYTFRRMHEERYWRATPFSLTDCVLGGPRLIFAAIHEAIRVVRFTRLDLYTSEQVLSYLATKNGSVSRDEMLRLFPELVWSEITAQLPLLEGVLFFRPDFSRITLTEPVRLELRSLLYKSRVNQPRATAAAPPPPPPRQPEPTPVNDPRQLSVYEILGVSPSASPAEIKLAYRHRIKECHPDRFANLGPEYQHLAEEWSKAINAAYDTLLAGKETKRRR